RGLQQQVASWLFWTSGNPPYNAGGRMASTPAPPGQFLCGRIHMLVRQPKAISCLLSHGTRVLLPFLFRDRLAIGDEITFAIPTGEAVRSEVLVTTRPS